MCLRNLALSMSLRMDPKIDLSPLKGGDARVVRTLRTVTSNRVRKITFDTRATIVISDIDFFVDPHSWSELDRTLLKMANEVDGTGEKLMDVFDSSDKRWRSCISQYRTRQRTTSSWGHKLDSPLTFCILLFTHRPLLFSGRMRSTSVRQWSEFKLQDTS